MILKAFKDSALILDTRYRMVRGNASKLGLWGFVMLIACAVFISSYAGQLIKAVATSNSGGLEASRIYATTYLNSYLNGEIGTLVATTLGLALVSVILAPFTGTAATSLISPHYLVSVRKNDMHKFTDSILAQFFSSVSVLQLITLTSVSSLLTIDGGRREGVLYAWASWPVLVIISTMFIWFSEYFYRRFGERNRVLMMVGIMATIALVVLLNGEQAKTVFGIGTSYATIIQGLHSFSLGTQILAFVVLLGLIALFTFIAYKASQLALSHPENHAKAKITKAKIVKPTRPSEIPQFELIKIIFLQLWRNTEIRKPLFLTVVFVLGGFLLLGGNMTTMASLIFVAPLMISLSWGSNIFGILGNGVPWLLSKPYLTRYFLWSFAGLQMVSVLLIVSVGIVPAIFLDKISFAEAGSFLVATIASSSLMIRSSLDKAVKKPHPYKSGSRGETIVPPVTIIEYTLRFSLGAGMIGFIMFSFIPTIQISLGIALVAVLWSLFRLWKLNRNFVQKPELRNKIVFTVAHN